MIQPGQQLSVSGFPRFITPLGPCFPSSPSCPTPPVLQALAKPTKTSKPAESKAIIDRVTPQNPPARSPSSVPDKILVAQLAWAHSLYKIGDNYVLSVVHGMHAMSEINILLNPEETLQALASPKSLEALAAKIRVDTRPYNARHIIID